MRKKKLLNLFAILIGVLMCFGFGKVYATDSNFAVRDITRENLKEISESNILGASNNPTLGVLKTRQSGNYYSWDINTTGDQNNVWKIVEYKNNQVSYNDLYYCLNINKGFGINDGVMAESARDTYTLSYDMKSETDKSAITTNAGSNVRDNYNKILWILENSYIPGVSSNEEKINLLKNAASKRDTTRNFAEYLSTKLIDNDSKIDLTDEEIEVVQQLAIWHYTNGYNITPSNLYKNTKKISGTGNNYDIGGYGVYFVREGEIKVWKMNALYDYLIQNASDTYENSEPTLTLNNSNAVIEQSGSNYIAGPFTLNGTNTEIISTIVATSNKSFTLLDENKQVVNNNDFTNVIGKEFYLRIAKNSITEDTQINLNLQYKYNTKTLTYMTASGDVQPVVVVKKEDKTKETETNINIVLKGEYDLVLVKEDENGEDLNSTATFEVNGQTKRVTGRLTVANDVQITKQNVGTADVYTIKETVPPDEYCKFDGTITVTVTKKTENGKYVVDKVDYTVTNGNKNDVNVYLKDGNIYVEVKNYPEEELIQPDLALRKYITKIDNSTITNRTPQVSDTDKLDGNDSTNHTARYTHPKNALEVKKGSIVEYSITIYNEGKVAARASKITDQLPKGLKFIDVVSGDYEKESYDETSNRLVLKETSSNSDLAIFEKGKDLNKTTVVVKCEVLSTAEENKNLTNIAWISEMKKENETFTADIDSQTTNSPECNKDNMSNYEGNGNDNGYYKGQQDDDDFDRIIITPDEVVPEKINKTVIKEWVDSDNEDELRTEKIEVQLYKTVDGLKTAVGNKIDLNSSNRWTYTWENLLKKENEKDIVYSVEEVNVPTGYTVSYSANNYNNVDTITITNTHIPEQPTGNYNVVLNKVDKDGKILQNAQIKVNGTTYTVGTANIATNVSISSTNAITLNYELEEIKSPDGYIGLSTVKNIKLKLTVVKVGKTYTITRAELVDNNGNVITDNDIKVVLNTSTSTINVNVVNNEIKPEFDLALRKFITSIKSGDKTTTVNREPQVDTSTIATVGTARYVHPKNPISVQVGDIVTYKIRVYNEGETDGYVAKITDHLPEWLDFISDDETNQKYLWNIDSNRTISTEVANEDSATAEQIYSNRETKQKLKAYDGGNTLDYIDVEIRCRVNEKAPTSRLLTNIAEISKMQDSEGTEVITDRDSTKANVNLPSDEDLPDYTTREDNGYFPGQEDDDDFEKVIVEKFDLALRKFITKIGNTEYDREPKVDTSKLGIDGVTTATYNHDKTPLNVKKGDIITYTLRVYNEGTIDGYANQIIDYIPEGLEFVKDSTVNLANEWKMLDKDGNETLDPSQAIKVVTDKKSEQKDYVEERLLPNFEPGPYYTDHTNLILGFKKDVMTKGPHFVDVQVQLKVTADPKEYTGSIITNYAEIGEDSNNDIDSTPGNGHGDMNSKEDDDDFEPVKLVYFDLALRKFITKVNTIDYNNRVPEVDTSKYGTLDENGKKITSFTYNHTKDPVVVETGSTVTYTIRVYNEGSLSGYAEEITDNIPEGLEFLPEDKTNKDYKWKMLDEQGNVTEDVTKAKKITTAYLVNDILDAYKKENGTEIISYKDVKVAFKVTEPGTSDRLVINTAEISKASDEDIDSTPGNDEPNEDDIDKEYLKVKYFDLALKKWVTATKVTYNGKTKTTKTGFNEDSTGIAKVDLVGKKLKKTTVKFVYKIKVINEGEVAGYATEVEDYIPNGLKFVEADNPKWKLTKNNVAVTDQLKDTLLEPGQSATIEIVLTWKNSASNMGVKTNWAEIKSDSGDDIDSTPDNYKKEEDDIDNAKVVLSIKTGNARTYIMLALISVVILGGGTFLIKKYVVK